MLIEFNLHLKVARIYGTIEFLKSLKAGFLLLKQKTGANPQLTP